MSVSTFQRQTVAQYLTGAIESSGKAQNDIAAECGWPKPNMVTMVKQGASRPPLDKIGPLAKSLGIDAVHLLRLTMQEYIPETLTSIESAIGGTILGNEDVSQRVVKPILE